MATPAAVLSILVKTDGVARASGDIMRMQAASKASGAAADEMAAKQAKGSQVIQGAAKVGALAVAGLGAAAVNAAGKYEASMNVLQSVSGATGDEMRDLSKLSMKLGADVKLPGTSAQDAAEAMTEMIKAGVSMKDTMAGVRSTLVLSAAANISNAEAAEIASNALNTFGLKGKDVKLVADQLANTANASSLEIKDVADATKMAGAVFSSFQGPVVGAKGALRDLNVALGLLGNAGIKGSDAGTSLKQALLAVAAPAAKTKELMRNLYLATDGSAEAQRLFTLSIEGTTKQIRDEASTALEKLQGSTKGMGDIAYDAAGRMRSLPEIIEQVGRATKDMTQEQRNQAITQIFGADATRSVLVLMRAGRKDWDKMTEAVQKQGAADDLAAAKMKGFKGSMEAFKSTLETLAITFGTTLLPAVTAIMGALASFGVVLSEHKTLTLAVIGVIGTLSVGIIAVNAATKAWAATTAAATAIQGAFNAVLAANPIYLVIAALVALGVGLVIAYKKSETFRNIVNTAFNAVKTVASAVFGWLKGAVVNIAEFLTGVWERIKTGVDWYWSTYKRLIINPVREAFDWVRGAVRDLVDFLGRAWEWIKEAVEKLAAPFKAAFEGMRRAVDPVVDALRDIVKWAKDAVSWIAKIKIPDVTPWEGLSPLGGKGGGNVGPLGSAPGRVDMFNDDAARFGNIVTSAFRPGDTGYHGQNRARDYAGGDMLGFAAYMVRRFGTILKELIFTPLGFGVKNGQMVPLSYWGSEVNMDHFDHVHVALARGGLVRQGGWALVGEQGPELARLPSGTRVFPADQSAGMLAGGAGGETHLHVHYESLVPASPQQAYELGRETARGLSYQGGRSSRMRVDLTGGQRRG